MASKLDRLIEKEAQLKAQIQQARAAERTLDKKRDTRRKILIGAAVMARVDAGKWPKPDLLEMMDGFLTRPHERELFGLEGGTDSGDDAQATGSSKADTTAAKDKPLSKRKVPAKKLPESAASSSPDNDFNL